MASTPKNPRCKLVYTDDFNSSPIILAAKQQNQYVNYNEYSFLVPAGLVWKDSLLQYLKINYSVLGSSNEQEAKIYL